MVSCSHSDPMDSRPVTLPLPARSDAFGNLRWIGILPTLGEGHVVQKWGFSFADLQSEIMANNPDLICASFVQGGQDTFFETIAPLEVPVIQQAARDLGCPLMGADWNIPFHLHQEVFRELSREQLERLSSLNQTFRSVPSQHVNRGWDALLKSTDIDRDFDLLRVERIKLGTQAADEFQDLRSEKFALSCLRQAERKKAGRVLLVVPIWFRSSLAKAISGHIGRPVDKVVRLGKGSSRPVDSRILADWKKNLQLLEAYASGDAAGPDIQSQVVRSGRLDELRLVISAF